MALHNIIQSDMKKVSSFACKQVGDLCSQPVSFQRSMYPNSRRSLQTCLFLRLALSPYQGARVHFAEWCAQNVFVCHSCLDLPPAHIGQLKAGGGEQELSLNRTRD